jgi:hypothetical protein
MLMNWLKQLLHRLLGTQAPGDEGPGQGSRVSTNRMPLKTLDNDTLFTETGLVVEPHLKEMASGRWGESFRYEAQQYALRWSVWTTDTMSFETEYWSVTIKPAADNFEIRCAPNRVIRTGLTFAELEKGLSRAARIGPAIRNIPVENILDENI